MLNVGLELSCSSCFNSVVSKITQQAVFFISFFLLIEKFDAMPDLQVAILTDRLSVLNVGLELSFSACFHSVTVKDNFTKGELLNIFLN